MLLFGTPRRRRGRLAGGNSADRFEDAAVVEESKRYGRALEGREGGLGSRGVRLTGRS